MRRPAGSASRTGRRPAPSPARVRRGRPGRRRAGCPVRGRSAGPARGWTAGPARGWSAGPAQGRTARTARGRTAAGGRAGARWGPVRGCSVRGCREVARVWMGWSAGWGMPGAGPVRWPGAGSGPVGTPRGGVAAAAGTAGRPKYGPGAAAGTAEGPKYEAEVAGVTAERPKCGPGVADGTGPGGEVRLPRGVLRRPGHRGCPGCRTARHRGPGRVPVRRRPLPRRTTAATSRPPGRTRPPAGSCAVLSLRGRALNRARKSVHRAVGLIRVTARWRR